MKLILDPTIKSQVDEILAPLKSPEAWKALNLSFALFPYAIVRLHGAPGMGKSALAEYMARQISERPPIRVDFSSVASPQLGETERNIVSLFQRANGIAPPTPKPTKDNPKPKQPPAPKPNSVIIMEECDSLLWSRDKVSEDTMFQLGFINTLLLEIDNFIQRPIPSLLIITTNYPSLLDAALTRRITDVISLFLPVGSHAFAIWKSKLPQYMHEELQKIERYENHIFANAKLNPAQIEQVILKACRAAFARNQTPTLQDIITHFPHENSTN